MLLLIVESDARYNVMLLYIVESDARYNANMLVSACKHVLNMLHYTVDLMSTVQ